MCIRDSYYYFNDIYAVLDDVFEIDALRDCEASRDFAKLSALLWRRVEFAEANRAAVRRLYHDMSRDQFGQYLYGGIDTFVLVYVARQSAGLAVSDTQIRTVARFCKYVLIGSVLEWLSSDTEDDLSFFLSSIFRFSDGRVRTMLEEMAQKTES